MRIKASLPSYKQLEVELKPSSTVAHLKAAICKKLGIEPDLTKLILRGRFLPEKKKLSQLAGIQDPVIVDYLWARHLVEWGANGQRKVRSGTVLLAGAGAIGNEVAKNLAMLGVGKLLVVDRDIVELSNVSRMIFFSERDVGLNKAEVLARNINSKYPYVETMAFRGDLEALPLKFYLDSDVIVCGLDNVVSRMHLTSTSRKYGIPMVDGGITGLNARAHSYIPPDDPCPICVFPSNQYSQIAGLRNPCDAPLDQVAVPSFATSISVVSSILAQETTKIIIGLSEYRERKRWPQSTGEPLRSVLFMDLKNNRFSPMPLKRSEKCFVCGKEGIAKEIVPTFTFPAERLREPELEKEIRKTISLSSGNMRMFSETSRGEKLLKPSEKISLKRGDYLRIISESSDGKMQESILKLT